ncbi:MAG: hypothetical protein ABGZ53_23145 [Fuerstiella sp.]
MNTATQEPMTESERDEFLDGVQTLEVRVSEEDAAKFQNMAVKVFAGESLDRVTVVQTLRRIGKTPDDLRSAVNTLEFRTEKHKVYQAGKDAEVTYPETCNEIEQLEAEFQAIQQAHQEKLLPLTTQRADMKNAILAGESAKGDLVNSVNDQTRCRILGDAMNRRDSLVETRDEVEQQLAEKTSWVARMMSTGSSEFADEVKRGTAEVKDLQARYDSFAGEFEKLATMEQEALNRLLEPELI